MANVKDQRNPSLMIRISPELNDRLDRVAEMYGVTRGEVARMAIGQYVGQVTGALDQMMMNSKAQAQALDVEKMMEAMIPKMIEAFKDGEGVPAHVEQGRTAPKGLDVTKLSDDELKRMIALIEQKKASGSQLNGE